MLISADTLKLAAMLIGTGGWIMLPALLRRHIDAQLVADTVKGFGKLPAPVRRGLFIIVGGLLTAASVYVLRSPMLDAASATSIALGLRELDHYVERKAAELAAPAPLVAPAA